MLSTPKTIGLWILQALMALVMVGPGVQKFTSPVWQRMFRVWGYPEHFYAVIGAIEVIAGAQRHMVRDTMGRLERELDPDVSYASIVRQSYALMRSRSSSRIFTETSRSC
jgi:hypothetical protein